MIADISFYQGKIDWTLAREVLDLCIFRSSIGLNIDQNYYSYAKECGLPFGVYHYVKAANEEEAKEEAEFFFKTATNNNIQPYFFAADIEYKTQTETTTKPITLAFINTLRSLGAKKIGLYIGQKRYPYIQDSLEKFDFIWIPRYGKNTGYIDENYKPKYACDIWQYTSNGRIPGVEGDIDLNVLNGNKKLEWFLQREEEKENMAEKFTNLHFVEFCKKFVNRPYWYGTCVYNCTESLCLKKAKRYPSHYTSSRLSTYKKHVKAKEVCSDCVGLLKGYAWTNGGEGVFEAIGTGKKITNKYQSNNCPDKSANGMFSYAKKQGMEWGTIDTIPEIPGIAVRYDGHVGVYIGDGKVIEERGFAYGCQETELKKRKWLHWYKIPFIKYDREVEISGILGDRLLKKGAKGDDVFELQNILIQLGYLEGPADGEFGKNTDNALRKFQEAYDLLVDGEYGEKTHKALMQTVGDDEVDFEEDEQINNKEQKLQVTGGSVRIRTGDSTKFSILTTVKKGTKLTPILNKDNKPITSINGWYAVMQSEQIGWISGKYIKEILI